MKKNLLLPDRSKNTVIQYMLSADGRSITSERLIDRGHPSFDEPTTAALAGNYCMFWPTAIWLLTMQIRDL